MLSSGKKKTASRGDKGGRENENSQLHTSATSPSYCFLLRTSGAMYAGVPTVDLGCESNSADLEYPKSQILSRGAGRPSSSVFSSLRSRWQTPSAWQQRTPQTSCWKKKRASSSENLPALTMRSKSSPPAAYSITMPRCVAVRKTSLKRTMLGWRRDRWLTSSRSTLRSIWMGVWLWSVCVGGGGRGQKMGRKWVRLEISPPLLVERERGRKCPQPSSLLLPFSSLYCFSLLFLPCPLAR